MLIICAGMIRSGSTLQFNLVKLIAEKSGGYYIHANEPIWDRAREFTKANSGIGVMKSHFCPSEEMLPSSNDNNIIVVSTYRDLRDVALSIAKFQNTSVNKVIPTIYRMPKDEKKWFDRFGNDIYRSKYEEWTANDGTVAKEVERLAYYIGVSITFLEALQIAVSNSKSEVYRYQSELDNMNARSYYSPNHISNVPTNWRIQMEQKHVDKIERNEGVRNWLINNGYRLSK